MKAHMELHITNTTATILALINTAVTCTGLKKNHDYLKWHGFLKLLLMSNMLFKQTTWKHSPMCYSLLEGGGGGKGLEDNDTIYFQTEIFQVNIPAYNFFHDKYKQERCSTKLNDL